MISSQEGLQCRRHLVIGIAILLAGCMWVVVTTIWEEPLLGQLRRTVVKKLMTNSTTTPGNDSAVPHHDLMTRPQQQALAWLKQMEVRGAINTAVSTRSLVLGSSSSAVFPRQWNPCVVESLLLQKKNNNNNNNNNKDELKITVTGGSTVARPGLHCTKNNITDPHGGRYSNILEKGIREDPIKTDDINVPRFQVVNMGQGGEVSTRGALFLDRYIDPLDTDIIVWDYFVNDDAVQTKGKTSITKVQQLDYWLTRVKAHFGQASKPPPPIILLYLWEFRAGTKLREDKIKTMDSNPMRELGKLIDSYRRLGWDIAVINVGAAVDSAIVKNNTKLLLDDSLHPSCTGTHLIADLLEHSILTNLATECAATEYPQNLKQTTTTATVLSNARPPNLKLSPSSDVNGVALWQDLWNENSRISSASAWEPRLQNIMTRSILRISNETVFGQRILQEADTDSSNHHHNNKPSTGGKPASQWPLVSGGRSDPSREDRKYGYRIPRCGGKKHPPLLLTLQEPNLKWIGLALEGKGHDIIEIYINNQRISAVNITEHSQPFLSHDWIGPLDHLLGIESAAEAYTLHLCHRPTSNNVKKMKNAPLSPNLQYLLGVVVPALKQMAIGTMVNASNATTDAGR